MAVATTNADSVYATALSAVSDTLTDLDAPEPAGTTITVQLLLFIDTLY
jgi:hypothetical protein